MNLPPILLDFARLTLVCIFCAGVQQFGWGQQDHTLPPISYETAPLNDRVTKLIRRLETGETTLRWDDEHGWLPDLLEQLDIPASSQTLVFSKTSQQHQKIRPSNPRAIYFNDDVYLGFVPAGDFLEIASVDPTQGAIFYTLEQGKAEKAIIKRDMANCLSCHESHKTQGVPGFLVRSVYPKRTGHPEFRFGTTTTDHRTPFGERFGGWYVTGQHGSLRHRGNALVQSDANVEAEALDREAGANQMILPDRVRLNRYIKASSDIVALMLLEHQTQFHNFVTKASFETRIALHHQSEMNRVLERDPDYQSDSTKRRIERVADDLVKYLLFQDEYPLTEAIIGDSDFVEEFQANSIRDQQGRSLKDLDLKTRMLKYPCSYLIYSESFCSLPKPVLSKTVQKIKRVLHGDTDLESFEHLSSGDKKSILEILEETHPLFRDP